MFLSISTRWNASRHASGETMIEEILDLGLSTVELGYDLTLDLLPGVQAMVEQGAVCVASLHCYCPVPLGVARGHPELVTLADRRARPREHAVSLVGKTVETAALLGARTIVLHAGNVDMGNLSPILFDLHERGLQHSPRFEKTRMKLMLKREKLVGRHLPLLYQAVETLLPTLEEHGVRLAFENLPFWEAVPCEGELHEMLRHFHSPWLAYWHDTGHAFAREQLGFINQKRWLEKLEPHVAGLHLHDAATPARDHLMPPAGKIDFSLFSPLALRDIPGVLEPRPGTPADDVAGAIRLFRNMWPLSDRPQPKEPSA